VEVGIKMATRRKKTRSRSITSAESEKFLSKFFEKYEILGAKMSNHKKVTSEEDTYTLTIDRISLEFLGDIAAQSKVKDIYYNPVYSPPGTGYGINLRYRLYVKYQKINF
tara:strand:+ start:5433 stop:5762 length:330 start_codon:yes stop_codon:yes gene_type:complete